MYPVFFLFFTTTPIVFRSTKKNRISTFMHRPNMGEGTVKILAYFITVDDKTTGRPYMHLITKTVPCAKNRVLKHNMVLLYTSKCDNVRKLS